MEQNMIDLLLELGPREGCRQKIKMRDMSARAGKPVAFTVRELTYNEIRDISRMEGGRPDGDVAVAVILAGVVEPDLPWHAGQARRHRARHLCVARADLAAGDIPCK